MNEYKKMSDFEINKAVTLYQLGLEHLELDCVDGALLYFEVDGSESNLTVLDYCNNPSDAWPIIVDNKIGVSPHGEKWMANNFNPSSVGSYQVQTMSYDKNPLRAAMIVFLMMREAK